MFLSLIFIPTNKEQVTSNITEYGSNKNACIGGMSIGSDCKPAFNKAVITKDHSFFKKCISKSQQIVRYISTDCEHRAIEEKQNKIMN